MLFTCGHRCGFCGRTPPTRPHSATPVTTPATHYSCPPTHLAPRPSSNCSATLPWGKYCIISWRILKVLLMRLLCLIYYSLASQGKHSPSPSQKWAWPPTICPLSLRLCQVIFALRLPDNLRRFASDSALTCFCATKIHEVKT